MYTFKRHKSSLFFLDAQFYINDLQHQWEQKQWLKGGLFSVSLLDLSLLTDWINILQGGYCNPIRDMGITRGRVGCQKMWPLPSILELKHEVSYAYCGSKKLSKLHSFVSVSAGLLGLPPFKLLCSAHFISDPCLVFLKLDAGAD